MFIKFYLLDFIRYLLKLKCSGLGGWARDYYIFNNISTNIQKIKKHIY
jgi:serine protease inhibitor ecotin